MHIESNMEVGEQEIVGKHWLWSEKQFSDLLTDGRFTLDDQDKLLIEQIADLSAADHHHLLQNLHNTFNQNKDRSIKVLADTKVAIERKMVEAENKDDLLRQVDILDRLTQLSAKHTWILSHYVTRKLREINH